MFVFNRTFRCALLIAGMSAFCQHSVFAQDDESRAVLADGLHNQEPSFYVHAELDQSAGDYRAGDNLTLRVTTEQDAYLYILYEQADGQVFQVFPNSGHPDNRIAGGNTVTIPEKDDLFRWVIGPPFGTEYVKVIASREPLEPLASPEKRGAQFNPVSNSDIGKTADALAKSSATDWAEVEIEVRTYPRDETPGAPGGKRYGVFFGIANFVYNDIALALSEDGHDLDIAGLDNDATRLADAFREHGRMADSRVYVNAEATRANFEHAITEWLPSVSRPGDTVYIYLSSHGGQMPDDNGDETGGDQMDEYLLLSDFLGLDMFAEVARRLQNGEMQVSDAEMQRLQRLAQLIQNAPDDYTAAQILTRQTGVSDDLFGRWLQHLAGRQVLVILDTCHSGGFATGDKAFEAAGKQPDFDFLDGESERLKDIGQKEQALITAAYADQSAYPLPNGENSVFTYFMMEGLSSLEGPADIEGVHSFVEAAMETYWNEVNRLLAEDGNEPIPPHQPLLKNMCTLPLVVIPE